MKLTASLLLIPCLAFGEVSIGPSFGVYDTEAIKSETGLQVRAGDAIYLWASYEKPDHQMVGQDMGGIKIFGGGAGIRTEGKAWAFGEFGYFLPKVSPKTVIQDEAVTTTLRNNHGPIPFCVTETSYRLAPDYGGRVGVGYAFHDHAHATLAYRVLRFNQAIDAWQGPFEFGVNHWQERGTLNLSSVEFGVSVRF